jgi:hypothetical protein
MHADTLEEIAAAPYSAQSYSTRAPSDWSTHRNAFARYFAEYFSDLQVRGDRPNANWGVSINVNASSLRMFAMPKLPCDLDMML